MSNRPLRRAAPHPFQPLTMTWREVADAVFRVTEQWLRMHITEFPDFPQPDPRLDVFATRAVEMWVERRFGLVPTGHGKHDAEARLLGKIRDGQDHRALPGRPAA
jgi:hypothetical protein